MVKRPSAMNTLGIQFAAQAKVSVPDQPLSAGGAFEAVNTGSSGRSNSLEARACIVWIADCVANFSVVAVLAIKTKELVLAGKLWHLASWCGTA